MFKKKNRKKYRCLQSLYTFLSNFIHSSNSERRAKYVACLRRPMNPSDSSLNCFAKSCHVMWIIQLQQLPGSRGRHPVVSWGRLLQGSHRRLKSSRCEKFFLLKVWVQMHFHLFVVRSSLFLASAQLFFTLVFTQTLTFCGPGSASRFLSLLLMAFDELSGAVGGKKRPLWNLRGQLIIIMPTQADKGRWGESFEISFVLHCQTRQEWIQ